MLPLLWVAAATLLSGAQAAVPRIVPRLVSSNGTTTAETTTASTPVVSFTTETTFSTSAETTISTSAETTFSTSAETTVSTSAETTSTSAETTINTPGFTTSTSLTSFSESTNTDGSTPTGSTSLPTYTTASSTLTFGSNGGITISGVITIPSASLPTSFQSTGTGAFVGIGAAATNAGSSFSNIAAAASAIAANPSPSAEDVQAFQNQAQDNFEQLSALEAQVKDIDQGSLDDDDSHKVTKSLAALAALLAWYSTELSALAPVLATPALAAGVFADLAPAFAAVAAGDLLANALDDLEDLDDDDDDNNNSSTAEESTSATSTETSTTSSATSSCSALPYTLDLYVDGADIGDDMKRSINVLEEYQPLEKRAPSRSPTFGSCVSDKIPTFPNYPNVKALAAAEVKKFENSPSNKLFNQWVLKWYDRKVDCDTLEASWVKLTAAEATTKAGGTLSSIFNVDHVWELKFFTNYFSSFLPGLDSSTNQITCDEFLEIFVPDGNNCPLATLMQALPSSQYYPEFMAMRINLNTIKGRIFQLGGLKNGKFVDKLSATTAETIEALQDMGVTASILRDDLTISRFDTGNQRIYEALKVIDARVTTKGITLGTPDFKFADTFQTFMADRLGQATSEAWEFVQTWMAVVESALATLDPEDVETQKLQKNYNAFKASGYAEEDYYSWGFRTDLAGYTPEKRDLWQRDLWERAASCPLNPVSSSVTTAESTTDSLTSTTDLTSATTTGETTVTTDESTTTSDENTTGQSTTTTEQTTTLPSTTTTEETTTLLSTTTTEQTTTPGLSTTTSEQTTEQTDSGSTTTTTTTSEQISSAISTPTTFSTAVVSSQSTSEEASVTSIATTSEAPTSTHSGLNAQTITTNGMVCVLVEGSLDPVCEPLETPTPNPDGTNVHVNSGCILINGSPRCASDAGSIASVYQSFYNVASDPNQPYGTILVLSGFNSSIDNYLHSYATCELQARWPANYGDIYFGADGCLYDSDSNKIYDQCCGTPDPNNSGPATNPYVAPAPQDSSQSSGNHHGSSICASISKDTCLAAAARYVDDIVYHQYTSAVWPDSSGADIANEIFPVVGPAIEEFFGINYGCTVIWTCDNDDAFAQGMTGKQIKDSMLNIYNLDGAKGCGSTYLENSCHITVNGCNNCRDEGRDATIWNPYDVYDGSYGDANDGFPPES